MKCLWLLMLVAGSISTVVLAQEGPPKPPTIDTLTSEVIHRSVELGQDFLIRQQRSDGTFPADGVLVKAEGTTCLAISALVGSQDERHRAAVQRGLRFLRGRSVNGELGTHDASLILMVLLQAGDEQDVSLAAQLARLLESRQTTAGGWLSLDDSPQPELSLTRLAVTALAEYSRAGLPVAEEVWTRTLQYLALTQNPEGSWGALPEELLTDHERHLFLLGTTWEAMSTASICQRMIERKTQTLLDGSFDCNWQPATQPSLIAGQKWLQRIRTTPEARTAVDKALIYHFYSMERSNRWSGMQLVDHETGWFLTGCVELIRRQDRGTGQWSGTNPVIATSHALLYLRQATTPILVNKLVFSGVGDPDGRLTRKGIWNRHPDDIGALCHLLTRRPLWPDRMTTRVLSLTEASFSHGIELLREAPVLLMTGSEAPALSAQEIQQIREYLRQGGFLLAFPSCQSAEFEEGFRKLVPALAPDSPGGWSRLSPAHAVYRTEFVLDPSEHELYGLEMGCRTSILYSPEDLGADWSLLPFHPPQKGSPEHQKRTSAFELGVNIMAYGCGRISRDRFEIATQLRAESLPRETRRREVGLAGLGLAADPLQQQRALEQLLGVMNRTSGIEFSSRAATVSISDPSIYRYPLIYFHSRGSYKLSSVERESLKSYLDRGGILFADACCSSPDFDRSFRKMIRELNDDYHLERISANHEIFSEATGYDTRIVHLRRGSETSEDSAGSGWRIQETPPLIEGVRINGRYGVLYSRYDLGCALSALSAPRLAHCEGYIAEDAFKLGTNIVLYSLLAADETVDRAEP